MTMYWWEQSPERFFAEFEKMQKYTNAEMRITNGSELPGGFGSGLLMVWDELITSNSGRKYRICIVCGRNHPHSAPRAWILEPKVRRCHHMFGDDSLCLHDPSIGPDLTWALNVRNWSCEWVHCYETGKWPKGDYVYEG